jgi:CRISPR-associated protein Csm4
LCWQILRRQGPGELANILHDCVAGDPPFVVSNGFPSGYLPRPMLGPVRRVTGSLQEDIRDFRHRREIGKCELVRWDVFEKAIAGESYQLSRESPVVRTVVYKNQINRLTGTTSGPEEDTSGQLFDFEEILLCDTGGGSELTILLRVRDDYIERCDQLFRGLCEDGYGKRKSVGYGELELIDFSEFDGPRSPDSPNGFVVLSNYVPAPNDPVGGRWQTLVKYAKLGEEFAADGNPFKKPVLMFIPGSCFADSEPRPFYGRFLEGISPARPEVVQCGVAFAVPAKVTSQRA